VPIVLSGRGSAFAKDSRVAGGLVIDVPRVVPALKKLGPPTVALVVTLIVLLALLVVISHASSSVGAGQPVPLGPGCDRSRPAVPHYAGGTPAPAQESGAPIPCATFTGNTTESAAIGLAESGTVFYAPLLETGALGIPALSVPSLVARSVDQGASWDPRDPGIPPSLSLVPWMHVDPRTSRLWLATPQLTFCGAEISWSDDEGEHWHTNPSVGCPGQGALKVLEGPAPAGGAQPVGYPHVVYYCANLQDGSLQSILHCYRSLDGGTSFVAIGSFPDPIPPPPACGTTLRQARAGVVGPDGALYFPLNQCGALGLAVSRDEGASWEVLPAVTTEIQDLYIASIAVDTGSNLYIAWMGPGTLPYLTMSRDRGHTWSTPVMVAAPGVQRVRRVAVTARTPGHIALAYLGSTDAGANWSGYITETRNALDVQPVFWSASINDPAEPLIDAADPETFGDRLFFSTAAIGPDGTAWAGFHCAKTGACPDARVGVAARLAWPAVECIPVVEGPIPITDQSQPYRAFGVLPPSPGHEEQELFISCTALGATYKTLLHLRRPIPRRKISDTVVVEPTHPLGLWPITTTAAPYLTDAGHVSVAVVSSPLVLGAAKAFNPLRYQTLDIPDIAGIDLQILAQVGALLKSRRGRLSPGALSPGPLRDVRAKHVILGGYSNTGAVVRDFIATKHDQTRLPSGDPVYDGYFPVQTAVGSAPTAIPDLDVPVLEIQGESELIRTFERGFDQLGYRRPDGPTYRLYEVAGLSHVTSRPGPGFVPAVFPCVEPTRSLFPQRHVWSNALKNLVVWVDRGFAPPMADRIALAADGRTVVRDEHGNAVGGVRTPYLDVPIATHGAVSTNVPGSPPSNRCDFYGYQVDFPREKLVQLYGDHAGYVRAVNHSVKSLVRKRWYLRQDAAELRAEAAQADVP
jgi:Alpha/beta hydrolase domain